MEKILSLFFRTLYLWTVAYVTPLSISYSVFLTLLASFSYMFPLVYSICT
jgi:hypothetical protein